MDAKARLAISSSPALADLSDEAVAVMSEAAHRRTVRAGEVLFDDGAEPDGLVVVDRGRLGFLADDGSVVSTMGRGDVVGELGAITGRARSGTVVALRDTSVLEIAQDPFDAMFDAHPDVGRALTGVAVSRLLDEMNHAEGRTRPTTVAVVTIGPDETELVVKALDRCVGSTAVVTDTLAEGRTDAECH